MKFSKFAETFQEPNGVLSFSRVSSALVLSAWLIWVSVCVAHTYALPSGMWEISTVVTALYGINKVSAAITGTSDKKDDNSNG